MAILKQLFDEPSSTLSYLLGDPVTGDAAVIDPVAGQEEDFLALLKQYGCKLRYVLETHVHDDHLSAAPRLRKATGARLAMHERAAVSCCDRLLRDGDLIYLGEELIEVIHTPGHTPCSVTYGFGDRLFTGDTLGIGWVGSLLAYGADARQLYDSVHERLYTLPNEMLIYPAHDRYGRRVSCIGQEKLSNRDLTLTDSRDDFLASRVVSPTMDNQEVAAENRRCGQYLQH